jgi:urea carboxylase
MEGPGGYQFVGRTLQVWNRFRQTKDFREGKPWLLRFFDQIRFYPVGADELLEMRDAFLHGRFELETGEERFSLGSYRRFLEREAAGIGAFKQTQQAAFEAERRRWAEADGREESGAVRTAAATEGNLHEGAELVESHVHGSVWQVQVTVGARVRRGEVLVVLESMKMEIAVEAPMDGTVLELFAAGGREVTPGQALVALRPEA